MGINPTIFINGCKGTAFCLDTQIFLWIILWIGEIFVILQQNEEENERTRGKKSGCVYGTGATDV